LGYPTEGEEIEEKGEKREKIRNGTGVDCGMRGWSLQKKPSKAQVKCLMGGGGNFDVDTRIQLRGTGGKKRTAVGSSKPSLPQGYSSQKAAERGSMREVRKPEKIGGDVNNEEKRDQNKLSKISLPEYLSETQMKDR